MASDKEAKRLIAVLYFDKKCGAAYKHLAARVRSEGSKTILVWSNHFKGPEKLIPEARAVIIQADAHNAQRIANAYETLGQDVEIHYADADGQFCDIDAGHDPAVDIEPDCTTDQNGDGSKDEEEATNAQESVSTDAAVQVEADDSAGDDEAKANDSKELDARSDEEFFDDAAAPDEESADEVGSTDSELQA